MNDILPRRANVVVCVVSVVVVVVVVVLVGAVDSVVVEVELELSPFAIVNKCNNRGRTNNEHFG